MELVSGFFFASLVLSWCPVLFSNIFFCCFLTLEKLKIANKASCDKGARFLQGLLFKYLLCICCLELLNMHWKSDFRSTFCVDLGHFIPSLCRAEQIGRSVRCFEQTRNRLSFRKDLCCKPPVIFCQLRASKQNLSLCCCVLLYFCPRAALRSLQHSHRCRCTTDSVCVFHKKGKKKNVSRKRTERNFWFIQHYRYLATQHSQAFSGQKVKGKERFGEGGSVVRWNSLKNSGGMGFFEGKSVNV